MSVAVPQIFKVFSLHRYFLWCAEMREHYLQVGKRVSATPSFFENENAGRAFMYLGYWVRRTLCRLRRMAGAEAVRSRNRCASPIAASGIPQAVPQRRLPLPNGLLRQAVHGRPRAG